MNADVKLYEPAKTRALTIDEAIEELCRRTTEARIRLLGPPLPSIVLTHEACPGKVYRRIASVERFKADGNGHRAGEILTRSAVCFVKLSDGSIWKPAGWKGPAKNFARGNVFNLGEFVPWSY